MGFIVSARGIEANPAKIKALIDMTSPRKHKDVQSLTGRAAALNRFMSRATDKCIPFFNIVRGSKNFEWTEECEQAFQQLKIHLSNPSVLSKPIAGETLLLYMASSENAINAALVQEESRVQRLVYYVSKRLLGAESRYPLMEKLVYCLIITSRRLRPYFQAHPIKVLTDHPLKQVMQKLEASGRLLKWSVELSQFDVFFHPRKTVKGHALADFITECTGHAEDTEKENHQVLRWELYVDGASDENGAGAGVIAISPEGHRIHSALRFKFDASNKQDCA